MATISKADYLKKYLEKPDSHASDYQDKKREKKKHKRKRDDKGDATRSKMASSGVRIFDDDYDMARLAGGHQDLYSEDEEERPLVDGDDTSRGDRSVHTTASSAQQRDALRDDLRPEARRDDAVALAAAP